MNNKSDDIAADATVNNNDSEKVVLDEVSEPAWQAYNQMFETKQQHYDFLELLENKKKKFNISPSQADQEKLAGFLSQHDEQVKHFTRLSMELKNAHPESHTRLFSFIAKLGDGEPTKKTQH